MGEPDTKAAVGMFVHAPVMLDEVLALLAPMSGRRFVDVTVGGGGHASALLERGGSSCELLGLDQDPLAVGAATERLQPFGDRARVLRARASQLSVCLAQIGWDKVDGVLADLGVSSPQLDTGARGFSFRLPGPLDMRMDPDGDVTAADIVNTASERELSQIFRTYGEERFAHRIAAAIFRARERAPLKTTLELASLVERVVPRGNQRIHPATRVFQALRIAVNQELQELKALLQAAHEALRPGGRVVVISFHSLEDRIVKDFFREKAARCVCPPEQLFCRCEKRVELRVLTAHPVVASEQESEYNPRARSAKVRAAEKIS